MMVVKTGTPHRRATDSAEPDKPPGELKGTLLP